MKQAQLATRALGNVVRVTGHRNTHGRGVPMNESTHVTARVFSSKQGFTIVELLIVIVVIAILAAISIVAFNGIQERSKNTRTVTGTKEYIKALSLYAVDKGDYPAVGSSCLGSGYNYGGDTTRCAAGDASIYTNVTFDAALASYLGGNKPQLDTTNLTVRNNTIRAGAYYDRSVPPYGVIYYMLAGKTASCDAGGSKTLSTDAGVTGFYCTYELPKP